MQARLRASRALGVVGMVMYGGGLVMAISSISVVATDHHGAVVDHQHHDELSSKGIGLITGGVAVLATGVAFVLAKQPIERAAIHDYNVRAQTRGCGVRKESGSGSDSEFNFDEPHPYVPSDVPHS